MPLPSAIQCDKRMSPAELHYNMSTADWLTGLCERQTVYYQSLINVKMTRGSWARFVTALMYVIYDHAIGWC